MQIRKARIVPGNQPHKVNTNTNKTEPQPLSSTANGGKMKQSIYRKSITKKSLPDICILLSLLI